MQQDIERKNEVTAKIARVRALLSGKNLQAIIINRYENVAWLSAGTSTFVNIASETGVVSLIITLDTQYALTNSIEIHRMEQEELFGELGFKMVVEPWHSKGKILAGYLEKAGIGSDTVGMGTYVGEELSQFRSLFTHWEEHRLREGGKRAANAMHTAIRAVRPGMSEFAVAGLLSQAAYQQGGTPIVNLIASDERIFRFRHPLPTSKLIEHYAMLVLCMRYQGLVASVTRLVHFGPLSEDLHKRMLAVAQVDAAIISGTLPGKTMDEMFALLKDTYASAGFPEAIDEHHQGGSMGYLSREQFALPGNFTPIQTHQGFAWNPSVAGVKSEDTLLLTEQGSEIVTTIPDWPTITVPGIDQKPIARPLIWVVD